MKRPTLILKTVGVILLGLTTLTTNAQISIGGLPKSFSEQEIDDSVFTVKMPIVNIGSLLFIDSLEQNQELPFRFGYSIEVDLGLNNSGDWDTLQNGDKIWRLKINSPEAYSINLI